MSHSAQSVTRAVTPVWDVRRFYGNAEMFARSMNELAKAAVRDVVEDLAKEFWPNPVTTENAEEMRPGVEAEAKIMGLSTEEVNVSCAS